jgi:SAM-dependent methyltransferase
MPAPFQPRVSAWQRAVDHMFFPVNMWLGEETSARLGLTPIDHERIRMALPHCRGRLLDIGCGNNLLVRAHGSGFGVDIHPYPEADALCDSAHLPFRTGAFDTVSLLACLNHIVRRRETLAECRRVLKDDGRLVLTMIPRWIGLFSHPIRKRHDPDQLGRGIAHEEDLGLSTREIAALLASAGFSLLFRRRFMWALNSVFVANRGRPTRSPI